MGVDARWICHTCKTMCFADGARAYLNHKLKLADAKQFLSSLDLTYHKIFSGYHSEYLESSEVKSLRDFIRWAKRHRDHRIQLTSDMSVSKDDFPEYRAESVDGIISKLTFGEELDLEYKERLENYCPACGSDVRDHPNREQITGVVKKD